MAAAGTLILIRRFPPSAALEIPSGGTGSAAAALGNTKHTEPSPKNQAGGSGREGAAGGRGFREGCGAFRRRRDLPSGGIPAGHAGRRSLHTGSAESRACWNSSVSAPPARPRPLAGALRRPGPCLARRDPWAASACTARTVLTCAGKCTSQAGKSSRGCAQDGCWQLCRGKHTFCRHVRACATTNSKHRAPHVGASPRATV